MKRGYLEKCWNVVRLKEEEGEEEEEEEEEEEKEVPEIRGCRKQQ